MLNHFKVYCKFRKLNAGNKHVLKLKTQIQTQNFKPNTHKNKKLFIKQNTLQNIVLNLILIKTSNLN